jgi:hypothetical protein
VRPAGGVFPPVGVKIGGTTFPPNPLVETTASRIPCAEYSLPPFALRLTAPKGGSAVAIYHCSIKIITRGKGKPSVAYRSGSKIVSEYNGKTSDYTRKKGIVYKEILLPYNAPR